MYGPRTVYAFMLTRCGLVVLQHLKQISPPQRLTLSGMYCMAYVYFTHFMFTRCGLGSFNIWELDETTNRFPMV